jgi:DNA repair protein RecN (Recombination protein N)
MLKRMVIKDFAIIDHVELDFHQGMTVLTGETGAGKSIIVDAISLLLGERADKEMISSKSDTAYISGLFALNNPEIDKVFETSGIDASEEILIERTISKDNRNTVKINNQNANLKTLKEIAVYVADIHSQFDTNQLINPDNYLDIIDNFRIQKITPLLQSYQDVLSDYKKAISLYQDTVRKKNETLKQLDLYKFQLQELTSLELVENEYQELNERINILSNIDKINTMLEKAKFMLDEDLLLDKLYEIRNDFSKMSSYSTEFENIYNRLNDLYYELDDIKELIFDKSDSLDFTKSDFDSLQERINDLDKIQKKYDKSIEELIEYRDFLKSEITQVENYDELIEDRKEAVKKEFARLMLEANNLSKFRRDVAERITKDIINTLEELVIKNADFKVEFFQEIPKDKFDYQSFKSSGIDSVDFLISTNKGEPLKSLAKTASGGEMSRVMLAFKTIFARTQKIPTIIFDEIDTGISGFIAKQIAKKIDELSRITQVISITHIPQVVAQGSHHLAVFKEIKKDKTHVSVRYLNYEERIEEIAKMVSNGTVSEAAKSIAQELLTN